MQFHKGSSQTQITEEIQDVSLKKEYLQINNANQRLLLRTVRIKHSFLVFYILLIYFQAKLCFSHLIRGCKRMDRQLEVSLVDLFLQNRFPPPLLLFTYFQTPQLLLPKSNCSQAAPPQLCQDCLARGPSPNSVYLPGYGGDLQLLCSHSPVSQSKPTHHFFLYFR